MTNIVRWDPFADMRATMDKLFDEGFSRPWRFLNTGTEYDAGFPVEVSETEEDIEIKAALPGVNPDEVEITVQNDVLTIKAEHKEESEDKKRDYYRREIRYGSLHRSMSLPVSVDSEHAEAHYRNGVLELKLPKAQAVRPRQIKVEAGNGSTPAVEQGS